MILTQAEDGLRVTHLKATASPMLTRERMIAMTTVTRTALSGILVRGLILLRTSQPLQ